MAPQRHGPTPVPRPGPRPRPGILDIAPYVGGESQAEGAKRAIRLASNENPLGPSPKAREAYAAAGGELHRYPEGGAAALRGALAELHGLEADRIVCGAGSDELISLLVRAYAGEGDEVLYSEHGFLMYPIAAKTAGATPVRAPESNLTADVDALLSRTSAATRLVFLANPNNPTGSYLAESELRRLHAGLAEDCLLVIDAAYAEYMEAEDYQAGDALVREAGNVVMLRTFSKIYGLAALRLGWAYCPQPVAEVLNRVRGPFNVTQPALAAGLAAVGDQQHLAESRAHNSRCRAWFAARAAELGIAVLPSSANFLLLGFEDAEDARSFLKRQGILTRQMTAYGLPNHLRVTIGTEEEMAAVAAALSEYLGEGG
ncbi:MAG: histidinol-phosphate transaminase [Rhodovibrionaceae bacterium]